jgi:hypothetical protein
VLSWISIGRSLKISKIVEDNTHVENGALDFRLFLFVTYPSPGWTNSGSRIGCHRPLLLGVATASTVAKGRADE